MAQFSVSPADRIIYMFYFRGGSLAAAESKIYEFFYQLACQSEFEHYLRLCRRFQYCSKHDFYQIKIVKKALDHMLKTGAAVSSSNGRRDLMLIDAGLIDGSALKDVPEEEISLLRRGAMLMRERL